MRHFNRIWTGGEKGFDKKLYLKREMINIRSYELKLYGSKAKFEDLAYSSHIFTGLTNSFIEHLYFNQHVKFYSTKGMGLLGNQAQRKATGIVRSKVSNEKNNEHKKSVPVLKIQQCFANIKYLGTHRHFNYKINFGLSFGSERAKSRFVFAKKTKPLKKAIQQGWKLSNQCEIYRSRKDNQWYVRIFVSREALRKSKAKTQSLGIDVGINHIAATSDGYLGNSLLKRLQRINNSRKERQRQFSLAKNRKDFLLEEKLKQNLIKNKNANKTIIKQLLDKEAKKLIACGLNSSRNLVVEDPKVLANLTGNKSLVLWAKTYLAYRLETLGRENGVFVAFVNPAYTSITCPKCHCQDKANRQGLKFHCVSCGHRDHADTNASVNLSHKGQDFVDRFILKIKKESSAVGTSSGTLNST